MFYRATACSANARYCYRNSVCLSVCPSVPPSVRRVYCGKTKRWTADILIPHETAITLVFWDQHWLVGDAPFPVECLPKVTHPFEKRRLRHISAYNVSTVRDSKKSSIMTNRKSITGFSTSYRWNAHVTPKSRMGGSKAIVFVLGGDKRHLQPNKVCYKVSLCENFQRQSYSTAIPLSNGPYTLARKVTLQSKI